jgi:uncharacterized membrane protein (DUF4010 family)
VHAIWDAAIAVGLGLMIGMEREHHDVREDGRADLLLGVRSFALLALLGWAAGYLGLLTGTPWLPAAALAGVTALISFGFFVNRQSATGLTSEIAALVTVLLGLLVSYERALAAALAVVTTLLLISKPWFGRLVPKLHRVDLTASLQIAILLAVVLPLLPAEARDPWGVLAPRRIGLFVTLIMGVSYVGYVLHRTLGARRGAGLTGLVGGLTSSTAVTAAMARTRSATGQMATFLANAVMAARVVVITAVVSREVALALAPAMAAGTLCLLGAAFWKWRASRDDAGDGAELEMKNPLSLVSALKWGVFLSFVLVAAAVGHRVLGDRGLIAAGALSGFADVDAITLAVTRQAVSGELARGVAVLAIVVAVGSNTVVKAGIAIASGGWRYGRDVALGFAIAAAAALATAAGVALG